MYVFVDTFAFQYKLKLFQYFTFISGILTYMDVDAFAFQYQLKHFQRSTFLSDILMYMVDWTLNY